MDNNYIKVELSLLEDMESSMSPIQKELLKSELEDIEKKHPMRKDEVCIDGTYMVDFHSYVEIGFFIRNGLENKLNFETIPVMVTNSKQEVLARQVVNLIDLGTLPPMSARSWKIEIEKSNFIKPIEGDDWKLKFDNIQDAFKAVSTVDMAIENIPEHMPYKDKMAIIEFFNMQPKARKDTFNIIKYKLSYQGNSELLLTLILRNAFDRDLTVQALPVNISTKTGSPVARTIFESEEAFKVKAKSAKLVTLKLKVDNEIMKSIDEKELIVKFE